MRVLNLLAFVCTLGASVVGGVFYAFSTFVMQALRRLPAREGIAAMQSINVVVINPMFLGVFLGTALASLVVLVMAVLRLGLSDPLGWAIALQAVIAALFSLIANHRIEWSTRLGYLLTTREAMRVKAVTADREALKTLSDTDELTGLANRGALKRWSAAAFSKPENQGLPATLLSLAIACAYVLLRYVA